MQLSICPDPSAGVLKVVIGKAVGFDREQPFCMLGKAGLCIWSRCELEELGYSVCFVEHATEALIV